MLTLCSCVPGSPHQGRNLYVKLGDKEVEYNKNFRLFLHTKLSNPHYPPEIQAETTLINFTVTESGLEDQLLALVVNKERPDLEETKTQLIIQVRGGGGGRGQRTGKGGEGLLWGLLMCL